MRWEVDLEKGGLGLRKFFQLCDMTMVKAKVVMPSMFGDIDKVNVTLTAWFGSTVSPP